jgi:alpha-glucosidase
MSEWWRGGVLYEIYPRSWQDSDGDGVGDLPGIVSRLDHLEWLGVDGIWLNPITRSPDRDWGYDVSDYLDVHPELGTLADADELIGEAAKRGISVVLDVVPAHTSDEHRWFAEARRSRSSRYRNYYVWSPPGARGGPPNNWLSYWGGSAWTLDEPTGEYYLHNFSPHQPQLNWWNPAVRDEFDGILRFWLDRGVAGFRLDALQALVHDRKLRDNPPAGREDTEIEQRLDQRFAFSGSRPEAHELLRRWRRLVEEYEPPRLLFGETWVPSLERLAAYYGNGRDELHLAWNLPFLQASFEGEAIRGVVERTLALLPSGATPAWAMSTHDLEGRAATRWCEGHEGAIRCALLVLLTLPGLPILYYGDEIGMVQPPGKTLEASPRDTLESGRRDASRTPMQWDETPGAGFTASPHPWLPVGDPKRASVAGQRDDPGSVLRLCRDLIALRRLERDLGEGTTRFLPSPPTILAWERGDNVAIALNLGDEPERLVLNGSILICTDRARDGEQLSGTLELRPREGAVIRRTAM